MNILGVIPARGGSKRIPHKNLHPLGGIPLICHCLRTAKKTSAINKLVVSTESRAIAETARSEHVDVLQRPEKLAGDDTPTLPVIDHAIETLAYQGFHADIVLTIQPTYPFLTVKNIEDSIKAFENDKGIDSVTTVRKAPFHFHPYNARRINQDGTISFMFAKEKSNCPNSQSAPLACYFGNLYATKKATIIEKRSLYGDRSYPIWVNAIESFDIDDIFDMEMAELIYEKMVKS